MAYRVAVDGGGRVDAADDIGPARIAASIRSRVPCMAGQHAALRKGDDLDSRDPAQRLADTRHAFDIGYADFRIDVTWRMCGTP